MAGLLRGRTAPGKQRDKNESAHARDYHHVPWLPIVHSEIVDGMGELDRLLRAATGLGCKVDAKAPASNVPAAVLGSSLDPELRALLEQHDGIGIRGDRFSLFVHGVTGNNTVEWATRGLCSLAGDFAYPFGDLVEIAQWGHQASYLCCVATLADDEGRQPVLWIDTHENPYALPVGSSVNRTVDLLGRYVDQLAASERTFPWEVADLIRTDAALVELARGGAFDPWLGSDEARRWTREQLR